jgi:phosphatidate cytidylyltransferase
LKRELTGIIAAPIVIGIVYYSPPILFMFFVAAVILMGLNEYFNIIERIGIYGFRLPAMILSFLLLLVFYFDENFILEWGIGAIVTLFGVWFFQEVNVKVAIDQISFTLFGILYISGLGGFFLLIRSFEGGVRLIFFLFLIVWLGDIAAYYWGKNFGKNPLAPIVSPNKTIEGSIAGLLGSLVAAVISGYFFLGHIGMIHCLLIALICGTIGQFGDLAESLIKRQANIKNSGDILPGHGGVLDRIDSLLFAGPAFYCYFKLVF